MSKQKTTLSIKPLFWLFISMMVIGPFYLLSAADALELQNPLGVTGTAGVAVVIGRIISALLGLMGVLSLLFFIWGGLQYLTSGGSSEKIKKGTSTIVWAVIGLVVSFGSYAILQFVLTSIGVK